MKRLAMQVAMAVVETMAVLVVDDKDGMQWRRWGGFNGGGSV